MFAIRTSLLKGKNVIPSFSFHPIFISFSVFGLALSLVGFMHGVKYSLVLIWLFTLLLVVILIRWWRELFMEFSSYERKVKVENDKIILVIEPANFPRYVRDFIKSTKVAMILFIISEAMFFFSFFWAFFHSLGSPAVQIGAVWPPFGLEHSMPNPLLIPLANTLILLTSGVTVTWAHFSILPVRTTDGIISGPHQDVLVNFIVSMVFTLVLAVNFIGWQGYEFIFNCVQMSDGIFGSTFYILTGFHGLHVVIGTIFLSVFFFQTLFEINSNSIPFYGNIDFTSLFLANDPLINFDVIRIKYIPSVGFDCAVWYWHFVDIVWLLLFSFVYLPDYLFGTATVLDIGLIT